MSTISTDSARGVAVEPGQVKASRSHRVRNRIAGALVTGAVMVGAATPAFAATGDTTDGTAEVSAGFDSITTFLTTVGIPSLIGLVVLGAVVVVGIKYLRKGASKA
ncbi:MAG TPA: hypothetical protein VGC67_01915 [Cellulomonas sp.]